MPSSHLLTCLSLQLLRADRSPDLPVLPPIPERRVDPQSLGTYDGIYVRTLIESLPFTPIYFIGYGPNVRQPA